MSQAVFRRSANRFCAYFDGYGLVPVADSKDDTPVFLTSPPQKVGDDAVVLVEGMRRKVRLLAASKRLGNQSLFLVDMGIERIIQP